MGYRQRDWRRRLQHSLPTLLMLAELLHGEDGAARAHGDGCRSQSKSVMRQPKMFQDSVLVNYYQHSKHTSFQNQLNYFGFKKRLYGGKKGKLGTFSCIQDLLT